MAENKKTTSNTPVSETDPGGTYPAPGKATGKPTPEKPAVQSGDQNANPSRTTD